MPHTVHNTVTHMRTLLPRNVRDVVESEKIQRSPSKRRRANVYYRHLVPPQTTTTTTEAGILATFRDWQLHRASMSVYSCVVFTECKPICQSISILNWPLIMQETRKILKITPFYVNCDVVRKLQRARRNVVTVCDCVVVPV